MGWWVALWVPPPLHPVSNKLIQVRGGLRWDLGGTCHLIVVVLHGRWCGSPPLGGSSGLAGRSCRRRRRRRRRLDFGFARRRRSGWRSGRRSGHLFRLLFLHFQFVLVIDARWCGGGGAGSCGRRPLGGA